MSVTAEMAMPHGNAAEGRAEDQRSSEVVIKPKGAIERRGTVVRAAVEDVRGAWVFTGAPPSVAALVGQFRSPRVPGDNPLLKVGLRAWLVVAIPLTLVLYGLAWAQQHPARAVVVDPALAGLAYIWLG